MRHFMTTFTHKNCKTETHQFKYQYSTTDKSSRNKSTY